MKEDELSDVDRLVFLMEEIAIIESRFQPEDTGHLRTTVGVIEIIPFSNTSKFLLPIAL